MACRPAALSQGGGDAGGDLGAERPAGRGGLSGDAEGPEEEGQRVQAVAGEGEAGAGTVRVDRVRELSPGAGDGNRRDRVEDVDRGAGELSGKPAGGGPVGPHAGDGAVAGRGGVNR